jgi:hypothetical protein
MPSFLETQKNLHCLRSGLEQQEKELLPKLLSTYSDVENPDLLNGYELSLKEKFQALKLMCL